MVNGIEDASRFHNPLESDVSAYGERQILNSCLCGSCDAHHPVVSIFYIFSLLLAHVRLFNISPVPLHAACSALESKLNL